MYTNPHIFKDSFPCASKEIVEHHQNDSMYAAGLVNKDGITSYDFSEYTARFEAICSQAYGRDNTKTRLRVDKILAQAIYDVHSPAFLEDKFKGDEVILPVDDGIFRDLFEVAGSMEMIITPKEYSGSHARAYWERRTPHILEFSALPGSGPEDQNLHHNLYTHMFHTTESAPRWGLDVVLGSTALVKARQEQSS